MEIKPDGKTIAANEYYQWKGLEIKICGIRSLKEVNMINGCIPDYAGFVFAESKRKVTCEEVVMMSSILDVNIRKVGVFVNEKLENIINTAKVANLDFIQLHGDESPEFCQNLKELLPAGIWKAVRVLNEDSVKVLTNYDAVDRFVLDTYSAGCYGGTGTAFDWHRVSDALDNLCFDRSKIMLAGGLNAHNLAEAVGLLRPRGVDASSGVEKDGYKDAGLMREFVELARKL